jgi:hypothetical protein
MTLLLSPDLKLPLDATTQTFAIIAKRGVGKTYLALVLVEELLKAGAQVVVADPVGVTWGLRAAANGKDPGLAIIVMGGDHGDVPLEATAGRVIAEFVVDTRASIVLDLSLFRKAEQVRFMTDFAETLYHRNRQPLHLVLDEADAFAPQRPLHGQERMLGAMQDLVRRGRARGIGVTLVTQRAAVLSKDVLTQVEVLVALRTIAPQDRAAIDAWIQAHDAHGQREQFMASLASLPIGTAWFWSPGWLDVFRKVKIRARETFDSSATPTVGKAVAAPKQLAPVDLEGLKVRIAATIEKAKAEDPRELRRRIQDLEGQLRKSNAQQVVAKSQRPVAQPATGRVEVPVLREAQIKALQAAVARFEGALAGDAARIEAIYDQLVKAAKDVAGALRTRVNEIEAVGTGRNSVAIPGPSLASVAPRAATIRRSIPAEGLTGPEQRILDAIAWMETLGITDPEQAAVAFLAGYTVGGGGFNNPRGGLNTKRLIIYRGGGRLALTEAGRAAAQAPDAALTTEELHRRVLGRLPGPEQKILRVLLAVYPDQIDNDQLAREAGYEPGGGGFNNPRGRLRSLGLIDYPERGRVVASALLFLEP